MNIKNLAALACALGLTYQTHCFAADPNDPFGAKASLEGKAGTSAVDHYLSSTTYSHFMCSMVFNLAKTLVSIPDRTQEQMAKADFRRCIKDHSETIKVNHTRAAKASAKNPTLVKELKEHYILVLDQMQGIVPGVDERVIDYERRTEAQKRATEKQTLRVKAELP